MKTKELKQIITDYYENECEFRDYRILPAKLYRKVNRIGIHQLVSIDAIKGLSDIEYELNDALDTFYRDGFPTIYIYI